ncbi:MAG: C45 family peptidase [Planctomycetota bacterium]
MPKILVRTATAVLAIVAGSLPAQAALQIHVVELSGSPYERGVQHGAALKGEIAAMLTGWRADLEKVSGLDADVVVTRFLAATKFDEAARRHTPELLDEVRGIAAGAGQAYETMLCYQLVDELWAQGSEVVDKCSTIGVDRHGKAPTLVAQNLDLPEWMHGHPTVLRIRDASRRGAHDALESLVVTVPGLVGANGVNNHRVAVGVNTILHLRPRPDGLPVAFVVRGLLARTSHAEALAFAQQVPHASGQAYTIGGPETAPCFEASAGGVVPWQPADCDGWRWHTNHPLRSRDWSPGWHHAAKEHGLDVEQVPGCDRYDALAAALAGARPDAAQVERALQECKAAPVCNAMTMTCTVMTLGEKPELRLTAGRPDQHPFRSFTFGK